MFALHISSDNGSGRNRSKIRKRLAAGKILAFHPDIAIAHR